MNKRDFWLGLVIGFWIGAILGTLTMAGAEGIMTCTAEGGIGAGYHCRMQAEQKHLREVLEYHQPNDVAPDSGLFGGRADPVPCLAQMEAAMRAMEPFVSKTPDRFPIISDDMMLDYDTSQDKFRKEIERLNKRDAAWSQWQTVKRACWQEKR